MDTTAADPNEISEQKGNYLFGPWIDFLGLGGASVIFLAVLAIFFHPTDSHASLLFTFLLLTTIINHPHFAHSYQIFYRDFRRKISAETPAYLRYRYWFAGIIAPIIMAGFYIVAFIFDRIDWVAVSVNLQVFLVGWHYVKQGYGMLSVDSVLKRKFFSDKEKRLLLWNAYAGWLFSWVFINRQIEEGSFQGLKYITFNFPLRLQTVLMVALVATSFFVLFMFINRMKPAEKGIPFNGVMAYFTSIYVWLIVAQFNPLFLVVIPAFHSLQYLTVVGRFQLNVEKENVINGSKTFLSRYIKPAAQARLVRFYLIGIVLGIIGFWIIPWGLNEFKLTLVDDIDVMLSLIIVWLFINIHHYFLDNVMWRKGNPDVGKHLFAHH